MMNGLVQEQLNGRTLAHAREEDSLLKPMRPVVIPLTVLSVGLVLWGLVLFGLAVVEEGLIKTLLFCAVFGGGLALFMWRSVHVPALRALADGGSVPEAPASAVRGSTATSVLGAALVAGALVAAQILLLFWLDSDDPGYVTGASTMLGIGVTGVAQAVRLRALEKARGISLVRAARYPWVMGPIKGPNLYSFDTSREAPGVRSASS